MENSSQSIKKTKQSPRWGSWPTWCSHTSTLTSLWLQQSTPSWRGEWSSTSRSLSTSSIWESKKFTIKAVSNTWAHVFSTIWTPRSEDALSWGSAIVKHMSLAMDKSSTYRVLQLTDLLSRSTSMCLVPWVPIHKCNVELTSLINKLTGSFYRLKGL